MASNLVLNGTTYSGTPLTPGTPRKPDSIDLEDEKIGVVLVADNGARRFVLRGTQKKTWTIAWKGAGEATRSALRTLAALTTTWTFVDQLGVSYTVQTEQNDYTENYAFTDPSNNIYYDLTLKVRQG